MGQFTGWRVSLQDVRALLDHPTNGGALAVELLSYLGSQLDVMGSRPPPTAQPSQRTRCSHSGPALITVANPYESVHILS